MCIYLDKNLFLRCLRLIQPFTHVDIVVDLLVGSSPPQFWRISGSVVSGHGCASLVALLPLRTRTPLHSVWRLRNQTQSDFQNFLKRLFPIAGKEDTRWNKNERRSLLLRCFFIFFVHIYNQCRSCVWNKITWSPIGCKESELGLK